MGAQFEGLTAGRAALRPPRHSLAAWQDWRRRPGRPAAALHPRPRCLQGPDLSEGEGRAQLVPGIHAPRRPLSPTASLPESATEAGLVEVQARPVRSSATTAAAAAELPAGPQSVAAAVEQHAAPATQQPQDDAEGGLLQQWKAVPAKYKAVFATSMSFVICNMDKVNISVAIIPMAQDFGWSPTISGLVQSSFFYGYLLSQVPGGYLVSRLGGRRVLPGGVGLWSLATAAVPVLAGTIPGLCASRAAVGLGEGIAPAAAVDIAARSVETSERARAISFIFGGLHVGSLLGLVLAPVVIENFGWPAVFYLFGGIGLAWSLWWERLMGGIAVQDPALAAALAPSGAQAVAAAGAAAAHGQAGEQKGEEPVPWRGFLRSTPLRALAYTHFCNNWFHYTFLSWLPSYFTDTLSLDLTRAAQVSILPPVAAIAVSAIAGPAADALLSAGVPVARVRKAAQCIAFLGPAACLLAASWVGESPGSGPLLVGLVALSLGLASFSLAGLYCNHADLSPRYAPVLLGLTNTSGALPGIIGVACTGLLYDITGSWNIALFAPSILFFLTGSAVYVIWGSADRQDFSSDNEPFGWEKQLRSWRLPFLGDGKDE